jgi:septal ring factor EnvC (AmiA/AmiB activator)
MQAKVEGEGEKEKELFDKYMCYCKNGASALEKSIADAEALQEEMGSAIPEAESKLKQLKQDVKKHQTDRADAKAAIASATAVREKEHAAYKKETEEDKTNLSAMKKAIAAISGGGGAAFLQTTAASTLKKLIVAKESMNEGDRSELVSFLSSNMEDSETAPGAGEVVGILKQMASETQKELDGADAAEAESLKSFEELGKAKKKEIEIATKLIEEKLTRIGDLGVEIQRMKGDLGDAGDSIEDDKKFAKDLEANCEKQQKLYDENAKMRQQELLALADTIKILNDDDALEMFKKTLPGASSFLELQMTSEELKAQVVKMVRSVAKNSPRRLKLDFMVMAMNGRKVGFAKVIKLIDEMIVSLGKEQQADEDKKEYCEKEFDVLGDKKKATSQELSDLETAIADAKEQIPVTTAEIDALDDGIRALDKQVTEATEQRKEESSDYTNLMASNTAAKDILGFAKNRLNKFYNPKLYKEPAPALAQEDPGPAPEGVKAYKKSSEESNGVIAMIDLLIKDLDKEMTEAEFKEKDAQEDYEAMLKDAATKRAQDSKTMIDKEANLAELKKGLEEYTATQKTTTKELMAIDQSISNLHGECDFLLKYFDMRAEARTNEIEAMKKCKAVLNGADYSLVQVHQVKRLLRK